MLPNGRVLYQRWEYTDQSHSNSRMLFHMNPDGTDQREFRGSGSWFPGSFFYAQAIPGEPHQVIGVARRPPRHAALRPAADPRSQPGPARRRRASCRKFPGAAEKVEPIVRDRLVDGVWPQFLMPWPLSAKYHLVAAKLRPDSLWGIYLVDVLRQPDADPGSRRRGPALAHRRCRRRRSRRSFRTASTSPATSPPCSSPTSTRARACRACRAAR